MDIASLYKTLLEAAQLLGPVGAAAAVLSGAAKEAGAQAYKSVAAWFAQDDAVGKPVQAQLALLEITPQASEVQAHLLQALTVLQQTRPDLLQSPDFSSRLGALRAALPMASNAIQIGQQTAEKIVNVGVVNGDLHL